MSSRFETTPERDSARYSSRTVMWLLGSMILIPVKVFIHGMEMLVRTMQGMEDATDRGLGVIAGEASTNGDGGEFAHYLLGPDGTWKQVTQFNDQIKIARLQSSAAQPMERIQRTHTT